MTPSTSRFSDLARIIKTLSPAIRTESDLTYIRNILDHDLNAADIVWASFSPRQKLILCKYFELHTVFNNEGLFLQCVEKTGPSALSRVAGSIDAVRHKQKGEEGDPSCSSSSEGGLFILVHGRATVTCGGYHLIIHDGVDESGKVGIVLGRLSIPQDWIEFFKEAESNRGMQNLYRRFVSLEKRPGEVSINFEKGSTYLVLPESKTKVFIEKLNASLIAKNVFHDVGLAELLDRQDVSNNNAVNNGQRNRFAPRIFRFRAGQILMKEGDINNRVLFIATGSCLIFRKKMKRHLPSCVGTMGSPSFIGFSALFDGERDDERKTENGGKQPVSVVAMTEGYAFSFCATKFFQSVIYASSEENGCDNPELMNAFQFLAECQMSAWCNHEREYDGSEGPTNDNDTSNTLKNHDSQVGSYASQADDDCQCNGENENDEDKEATVNEERASPIPQSQQIMSAEAPEEMILGQAEDMKGSVIKGKLNRKKFLTAIHDSFASDADNVHAEYSDEFDRFDIENLLLPPKSGKRLSEIIQALSKGCGVEFTKCEGNDPFHNFTITSTTNHPSSTNGDLHMPLQMPFLTSESMLNQLMGMTEKCLGKKRPTVYDHSDPFLTPIPSVLESRKVHGKTLPIVRRSKQGCSIDPMNYKEEKWI